MVDILALALSHGLLALAAWRLLFRPDLDEEVAREAPRADTPRQALGRKGAVRREMRWPGGSEGKGSGGGDSNDA
nr:hypothetical protein [Novosphingobium panipatense]